MRSTKKTTSGEALSSSNTGSTDVIVGSTTGFSTSVGPTSSNSAGKLQKDKGDAHHRTSGDTLQADVLRQTWGDALQGDAHRRISGDARQVDALQNAADRDHDRDKDMEKVTDAILCR